MISIYDTERTISKYFYNNQSTVIRKVKKKPTNQTKKTQNHIDNIKAI